MSIQENIGHNSGLNIRDRLSNLWSGLINRCSQLISTADDVPEFIEDEDTATKPADLVKLMKAAARECDLTRKQENEPYSQAKQAVDAFFKIPIEAIKDKQGEVERRLTKYLQRKADREAEERRQRAERERAESEERFAKAVEAERRANEAKQAAAIAAATSAAAAADKDAVVQIARQARMRAESALADARAAKVANDGAKYAEAMQRHELATAEAKEADARAGELRRLEREAEERRKAEEKTARGANRDVKANVNEAARSQQAAERLDKRADANQAELSRTRGELGSVSSLRTDWVHDSVDRSALDLEALRQHIPADALDTAIRSFVRAGGRTLRGARIFEQTPTVVR